MQKNSTPAKIALAWLLAQHSNVVPIPGTTNLAHLDENMDAVNVNLTAEDVQFINSEFAKITITGDRTSEALKQMSDVEHELKANKKK